MTARPIALTRANLEKFPLPAVVEATKDDHGKLLVVAGSRNTPGSAAITATAAMRAG
jgi:NAD(P)H-hydrate repair Nnr-like enzyme with NAD(P)H-hydrate dehydratase domain